MTTANATAPVGNSTGDVPNVVEVTGRDLALPVALPVSLAVRGQLAEPLRRTVEGTLGWQLVDEVTASLVPPAVRLADVTAAVDGASPTVLVVTRDDAPELAATATARLRPVAIVAWPAEPHELAAAAARATAAPRTAQVPTTVIRIGGAAGGTGTSTVALALAAVAAWRGGDVLVASGAAVLLPPAAPTVDPSALAAPDLLARAAPIPGVPGARAVHTNSPVLEVAVADPAVDLAVIDVGVADDVDVLVVRPDAAALAGLRRTAAAAVVVTGRGAVPARALEAAVGGRRRIDLPASDRVARAAAVGRVPASLPGSYLRALHGLLPRGTPG
ncbi:MAG: hypothetical protein WEB09_05625 [Nitriliruptor sp.]